MRVIHGDESRQFFGHNERVAFPESCIVKCQCDGSDEREWGSLNGKTVCRIIRIILVLQDLSRYPETWI